MLTNESEPSQAQKAILKLGEAGQLVADEVRADRLARRRHDRTVYALLVVVAVAVLAVAWFGWSNYRLNRLVADCTTPGRACFEGNKQQAAVNRSALTRANLFIVECAMRERQTGPDLAPCVERKLEAAGIDIALISPQLPELSASPVPSGPPADASIAPGSPDQPVEPSPV